MRVAGMLLLLAGWGIILSALVLLSPAATRIIFLVAGLGVEALGLVLALRSQSEMEELEPR